jgi:hypothetical protein
MSDQHVRTLMKLRNEHRAAIEASNAAAEGRVEGGLVQGEADFRRVVQNAEKTYYLRLCAEVEAMLYNHLGDHFRFDGLSGDEQKRMGSTADVLLKAVRYRLKPATYRQLPLDKYSEARAVYAYRNRLAHGDRSRQQPVSLERAFTALESLLLELPDMRK